MFGIVMMLNLALVLGMAVTLARATFEPLATVGDALRSFLREPDRTTEGDCLLTKRDVRRGRWGLREPRAFVPRSHLWLHTPSPRRWGLTALAWLAVCGPAAVGLALLLLVAVNGAASGGIGDRLDDDNGPWAAATMTAPGTLFPALGTPHTGLASPAQPAAPADGARVDDAAVRTALVAALPQLPVAVLYLAVNALLTTYFLGHEFALFAAGGGGGGSGGSGGGSSSSGDGPATSSRAPRPRPLRVSSSPAGQQTTSLYLTLPRPVSWLLLALFAGMGFLTSQAVSPLVYFDGGGDDDDDAGSPSSSPPPQPQSQPRPNVVLALNTTALLAVLAILAVLLVLVLGLGLRRAPPAPLVNAYDEKRGRELRGNPLAQALRGGSCSAVFSAACHPSPPPAPPRGGRFRRRAAAAAGAGDPAGPSAYSSARGCLAWGVVDILVPDSNDNNNNNNNNNNGNSNSNTSDNRRPSSTPMSPTATATTTTPDPLGRYAFNDGLAGVAEGEGQSGEGGGDEEDDDGRGGDYRPVAAAVVGRCAFSSRVAVDPDAGGAYASALGFVDLARRYA